MTNNSLLGILCAPEIAIDGSTSGTVENNALAATGPDGTPQCAATPAMSVSGDAAGTVTTDYNAFYAQTPRPDYTWNGTDERTDGCGPRGGSARRGHPRPRPARGLRSAEPRAGGDFTVTPHGSDSWGEPVGTVVDFGDGSGPQTVDGDSISHTYTEPGTYTVFMKATGPDGQSIVRRTTATVATTAPPTLTFTPVSATCAGGPCLFADVGQFTLSAGADAWEVGKATISFGDGDSATVYLPGSPSHTYAHAGTYTATVTATDVLGRTLTTDTKATGHLTAYAHGTTRPYTSNSNWTAGQTTADLVLVPLTDGKVVLHNASSGTADFVADLVGYYSTDRVNSVLVPTTRTRVLDTRDGTGTGGTVAKIGAKQQVRLQLAGPAGAPSAGASAAELNLTAVSPSASGYLTLYPDGPALPTASSLNYRSGHTVANAAVTPLGADGAIDVYNGGSSPVDVVIDLSGYYCVYAP